MVHCLLAHSSTGGHLDCFQVLTIMNKAAKNICVQSLFENISFFSIPLGN